MIEKICPFAVNSYRFNQPTVAATQWRVWIAGSIAAQAETVIRPAALEMAETPGGPDIGASGTTSNAVGVTNVSFLFDGNPTTEAQQTTADQWWVQKTFASPVLLHSIRLQAPNTFTVESPPRIVIIMQRNSGSAPWDVVHVSTGLSWSIGEVKTFVVASSVRRKGVLRALAWRLRGPRSSTTGIWGLSFNGLVNNSGQAFASAGLGGVNSRNAFDGVDSTGWTGGSTEFRIGQVYAAPALAVPTGITMVGEPNPGFAGWTPTVGDVEWTDDMETWTLFASVTFAAWGPAPPQLTQTVSIP